MYRLIRRATIRLSRLGRRISPAQYITLVFLGIILVGAALLALPAASRSGSSCGALTALFTATSATCVTGLSLVDTYTQWTGFGQVVILLLIQVGGLGFMTIISIFFFMTHARLGMKKRKIMQQAFGLNDARGVVRLVRHVLLGTALLELCGAVLLTLRFWRDFPLKNALWMGVFHAVSAFCNAGFDILGRITPGGSLSAYAADPVVNLTVMALIVTGGIGFFVWEDLWRNRRSLGHLSLYSKLTLGVTALLLAGGMALVALTEWNNPGTLGTMPTGQKLLAALFQSVTLRTAGFATFSQAAMTDAGKAICCVFMLIGGSSGSTAGGIKTVTAAVCLLSVLCQLRGRSRLCIRRRTIAQEQVAQAQLLVLLLTGLAFAGAIVISATGRSFIDALFETASALGTVGSTADLTPGLPAFAQGMLIVFMFFGRVGLTTISMGFWMSDRAQERFHYAEEKLLIG